MDTRRLLPRVWVEISGRLVEVRVVTVELARDTQGGISGIMTFTSGAGDVENAPRISNVPTVYLPQREG